MTDRVDRHQRARYVEIMNTLSEIATAAESLPIDQKRRLVQLLVTRLTEQDAAKTAQSLVLARRQSVLDVPPVHLGAVLRPLTRDDDLLGEMLEGRP